MDAPAPQARRDLLDAAAQADHGLAASDIEEWRDILGSYSIPRLSRFITSTSERANRLRQSNPFFAVLNSDEKDRLKRGLEKDSDT